MSLVVAILALGLLASLSPSTLIVFILLLATTRARQNAAAFLVGWTISLVLVFGVSYYFGGNHGVRSGGGHTAVNLFEILFGVGLTYFGVRKWGSRHVPRESDGASRGLTARVERLNPASALMLGVLKQPWTLTAAAAIVIVQDHTALPAVVIAFLGFTAISTATVGGLFVYYSRQPGEAQARLETLRNRLVQAGPALFAAVSFLVGVYLVVDGALSLAGI